MHYKKKIQQHRWQMYIRYALSAPFIYVVFIPTVILDVILEVYHRVCFPLYGIPYVSRGEYIRVDRHKLSFLQWYEKINCMYCGYMNGFYLYASAVARATEHYWCGVQHEESGEYHMPKYQKSFIPRDKASYDAILD